MWEQYEQYRVFQGPPEPPRRDHREAEREGGTTTKIVEAPARRDVYSHVRKHCAYLTCEKCFAKLQAGANLDDIHNRNVAIFAAALFALGALIIVITPLILPNLLSAFWWGDPRQ
jgi:hypothetical protein